MKEIEKYFVFEREGEYGGTKEERFSTTKGYLNKKLKFSSLTLLHFHFNENTKDYDNDYYLFFGRRLSKNKVWFSFRYNKGDEFTDLLINNGATYYRYDVAEILDSPRYIHKFKLKDDRIILYQTYSNGTSSSILQIYDISDGAKLLLQSKLLLQLPIADLYLDRTGKAVTLKWSGEEMPTKSKELLDAEEKEARIGGYQLLLILIISVIALILYYFIL